VVLSAAVLAAVILAAVILAAVILAAVIVLSAIVLSAVASDPLPARRRRSLPTLPHPQLFAGGRGDDSAEPTVPPQDPRRITYPELTLMRAGAEGEPRRHKIHAGSPTPNRH